MIIIIYIGKFNISFKYYFKKHFFFDFEISFRYSYSFNYDNLELTILICRILIMFKLSKLSFCMATSHKHTLNS